MSKIDLNAVEVSWTKWNTKGVVEDDKEFNKMVEAYQLFTQLYEIFKPKPAIRQELFYLQDVQARRNRKD